MNTITGILILRLVHIMSGVFWVGGVVILARFVLPSVGALGPAGGSMMNQLTQVRKLPVRLLIGGWMTVLSGLALYARAGSIGGGSWYGTRSAMTFGLGGALAIFTVLMGTFANMPTAKRMSAVAARVQAAGGAPSAELTAELQRLQLRLKRLTEIAAALLMLATAAMAVARYM